MIFDYKVINDTGSQTKGTIDALNKEVAISSLQRRGFIILDIREQGTKKGLFGNIEFFDRVKQKDVVILSRQIATLFEAGVSALKVFRLLSSEIDNIPLGKVLTEVADDLQGGASISTSLAKHPKVFTSFYVNMVRAGEESGKLNQTFNYLAEYLDRSYELASKTKNALIYPSFVIGTFIIVMVLMLTLVIPKLAVIIQDSGAEIPIYTRIVIAASDFLVNYGVFVLIFIALLFAYLYWQNGRNPDKNIWDTLKLEIPYIKTIYQKLYLARIADNLDTMLSSGIPIVRALEITGAVVENKVYEQVITASTEAVKGGALISEAFAKHKEMPNLMIQMMKIGEETGELGYILKNLAHFYKREVDSAVDTLVGLIEPVMIVALGVGVGFLLTSVLIPIYNIAGSI
ncbi:MAG: type II secretion system F family protein [Minisyncoccia bacterium]